MRVLLLSLLLVLSGLRGYSQVIEDTTVQIIPDAQSGIIQIISPEAIDSVTVQIWQNSGVVAQKKVEGTIVNLEEVERNSYYIVLTTMDKRRLIQKLYFF